MIRTLSDGVWTQNQTLLEALGIGKEAAPVISIVGGGGKTTTSRRLFKDFYEAGSTPIVTTTTHMQREEGPWYLGEEDLSKLCGLLKREGRVWCGKPVSENRMKAFSPSFLQKMARLQVPLIIEADGAKTLPCKVPSEKEPVIIEETTMLIAVYGMDAVEKPLEEKCFRLELVENFLGKSRKELLTTSDVAKIAAGREGGQKQLTDRMEYHVILNKADDENRRGYAEEIAKELVKYGVTKIHMTSFMMK